MWKNVHPVDGAGIQTHSLWNISCHQYPLDQGSHPKFETLASQCYETFLLPSLSEEIHFWKDCLLVLGRCLTDQSPAVYEAKQNIEYSV